MTDRIEGPDRNVDNNCACGKPRWNDAKCDAAKESGREGWLWPMLESVNKSTRATYSSWHNTALLSLVPLQVLAPTYTLFYSTYYLPRAARASVLMPYTASRSRACRCA